MRHIAVTDTMGGEHKFQQYISWLEQETIGCRRLSYKDRSQLDGCDGLLLTGGHDVDPSLYALHPHPESVGESDRRRDDFERQLLDQALSLGMPILGICRGLQLANVHFGGSLIPDLEQAGYRNHRSTTDGVEASHSLVALEGSLLHACSGALDGAVNSSHHQAADRLGAGLRVSARSDDGVIEAIERNSSGVFFLLVQWHPERMADGENPFSSRIREAFLSSINRNARGTTIVKKERKS